jgi:hypothetical protein
MEQPTVSAAAQRSLPGAARVVGWLAALMAVGCGLLAVGHAGVELPVVSAIGPGGNRPVPQAVAAFGLGTLAFATVAVGVFRRSRWAWPAATALNALALAAGLRQYRGAASAIGLTMAVAALALLATPATRGALLRPELRAGTRAR